MGPQPVKRRVYGKGRTEASGGGGGQARCEDGCSVLTTVENGENADAVDFQRVVDRERLEDQAAHALPNLICRLADPGHDG